MVLRGTVGRVYLTRDKKWVKLGSYVPDSMFFWAEWHRTEKSWVRIWMEGLGEEKFQETACRTPYLGSATESGWGQSTEGFLLFLCFIWKEVCSKFSHGESQFHISGGHQQYHELDINFIFTSWRSTEIQETRTHNNTENEVLPTCEWSPSRPMKLSQVSPHWGTSSSLSAAGKRLLLTLGSEVQDLCVWQTEQMSLCWPSVAFYITQRMAQSSSLRSLCSLPVIPHCIHQDIGSDQPWCTASWEKGIKLNTNWELWCVCVLGLYLFMSSLGPENQGHDEARRRFSQAQGLYQDIRDWARSSAHKHGPWLQSWRGFGSIQVNKRTDGQAT